MTKCKITRVTQSPLNKERWSLTLACGNETWVSRRKKPKIGGKADCAACTLISVEYCDPVEMIDEEKTDG